MHYRGVMDATRRCRATHAVEIHFDAQLFHRLSSATGGVIRETDDRNACTTCKTVYLYDDRFDGFWLTLRHPMSPL